MTDQKVKLIRKLGDDDETHHENLSIAQIEVICSKNNCENYYKFDNFYSFKVLLGLIVIQFSQILQRDAITSAYWYYDPINKTRNSERVYNIQLDIEDFTKENYDLLVGDSRQIFFAFMVLFLGSLSDLFQRKTVILISGIVACSSSFFVAKCTKFGQINLLNMVLQTSTSVLGPCAYSLISDLVPHDRRIRAYTVYALSSLISQEMSIINTSLICWFGWRQTFVINSLVGFFILGLCAYVFVEPVKGKFDIASSIVNNPIKSSEYINNFDSFENNNQRNKPKNLKDMVKESEYFITSKSLLKNDTTHWIVLAIFFMTIQDVSGYKLVDQCFQNSKYDKVVMIVGEVVCSMITAMICDFNVNKFKMKSKVCKFSSVVQIPCLILIIYLDEFVSSSYNIIGLFIKYLLTSGWKQPAIGIILGACDASVRCTGYSIAFFVMQTTLIISPRAIDFNHTQDQNSTEFIEFIFVMGLVACVFAYPLFWKAGSTYSEYKTKEAFIKITIDQDLPDCKISDKDRTIALRNFKKIEK